MLDVKIKIVYDYLLSLPKLKEFLIAMKRCGIGLKDLHAANYSFNKNGQLIIIDHPDKESIDLKLENILFENVQEMIIIDVKGCQENGYDIDLPNGETVDCNEIIDQFHELLSKNKLRKMFHEEPLLALINNSGNLYGGIVGSIDMNYDSEEYTLTFSIAVDDLVKRKGWARKLIIQLIQNFKSTTINYIRADVINENMIPLLTSIGFKQQKNENGYETNEWIYEL
jgi:N-acetylglutamate synthase-like GNAT family acetyltransferase